FLMKGSDAGNIRLQDNDVIIVQPLRTRVEIEGPVRRPGLFEVKPGETIEDLLAFAGGFSDSAFTQRLTVKRATGEQRRVEDVEEEDYDNFNPQDGDLYTVGKILQRYENRVQVSGAVLRPGDFALSEGVTVKSLLEKAGGLRGDAFLNRATLYRTNENFTQEVLTLDLGDILDGSVPDVALRREDVLNVASIHDIKEEYYLQISGEVNQTGIFPYKNNMTVGDLVVKARGFKESATNSFIEIARRIKDDPSGKIAEIITLAIDPELELTPGDEQIILQPFDHVFVRKSPGFQRERLVKVEGEVFYPGEFALEDNDERISDLLERSGGLNQFAYAEGAKLTRRTEFYKELEEEERKLKQLQSLLSQVDQEEEGKKVENTEAELALIERVEKRIEILREEEKKRREMIRRDREEENMPDDRYALLDGADTASTRLELRETEMVGIELKRILENPGSKYDLILQEGDVISIPKELQTVRMRGEVLFPTTARYDIKRSFKNYISRAGGFSEEARKSRSYVIYANGDVQRTKKFLFFNNYPHIEPGAEIIVPEKPERQPMSPQAWVTIGSGLATMALVVTQILNNVY
ncbi:MAG: SLBB domain-containing protein, partial [Anditalea sp.]